MIADQAQKKKKKKPHKTKLTKTDLWKGRDLWKQNYQRRMLSIQPMTVQVCWSHTKLSKRSKSLYNVKLVGESAPAMFPEYLKELIQDRGY